MCIEYCVMKHGVFCSVRGGRQRVDGAKNVVYFAPMIQVMTRNTSRGWEGGEDLKIERGKGGKEGRGNERGKKEKGKKKKKEKGKKGGGER